MTPLAQLRLRLTLWYAGVLTIMLLVLGTGLFYAIRRQISRQLDVSLVAATQALEAAAHSPDVEGAEARESVAEAVAELRIPDRTLYVLDSTGVPLSPSVAADWIRIAALAAARTGVINRTFHGPDARDVRLHAERFTGRGGTTYVAAVTADRIELEDRYSLLIEAFAGAAFAGLLLMAVGAWFLVRASTAPIERSIERMRRFMADAAHELRTPVTILRTRAEVALAGPRDPEHDAATLGAVEREAGRLGAIVGDLLTLARADAGDRPVERETLYLDDVASDAVDAARALAEYKGVILEVGTFDEARITGDRALLRQLVLIVLDNAIKFTPAGGRVSLDVRSQDGERRVEVRDTGIGIPADQLPHVFERFYRGDAGRRAAEGAGLGLAIARWIADAHGAGLDINSPAGQGTRVAIIFPAGV